MDKILQAAIIGCGMRSRFVIAQFQQELEEKLKIRAVYDPSPESIALAAECWKIPGLKSEDTMGKAVGRPDVDVVMIFSPNAFHCQAILAALKAGKKVFSEKPLATTLDLQDVPLGVVHNPSKSKRKTGYSGSPPAT